MNKYEGFVDKCYNNNQDLAEAMKSELKKILIEFPDDKENIDKYVSDIMDLFFETAYEW